MIDIKLPSLGDGIESGDVLEVLVNEGDVITKDQGIVELETDKATVEVPSTHAGTVKKVHVSSGDTIKIGAIMISIEAEAASASAPKQVAPTPPPTKSPEVNATRPDLPSAPPQQQESPPHVQKKQPAPPARPIPPSTPEPAVVSSVSADLGDVAAGPAIRRFAREVGVDLTGVVGTGANGRITRDDVLSVVREASVVARSTKKSAKTGSSESDAWGPIRIEKMPKIRRTIANKMYESWTAVPRVTNFDDADVSDLEQIRQSSKADYAAKGIKLTTMPFLIKSVAMALKDHPTINASIDVEADHVIYKEYVNVGIAVDTERGLVVPALRDADKMSIPDIARSLATMAEKVRTGEFTVDDLRGGTFTISNLGAIGGTYSTPIINVPEVAILLVGRSRKMPVVIKDEVKIRLMMPLSLSYDHRLVDGGAAARFLNEVISYLEAPSRLLLAP
ncbi:MAG: 2-oxo acid dehydrogenase subunit E2 [Planctomycetaceae bacterium]|nr:2-oxo acid dehydrogenase subunit E2 [Planctomycetales bacterium]MCB9925932.1 2-oxo acid dehydrogenase subunit E2 [Planctomycetaceae bacterium]